MFICAGPLLTATLYNCLGVGMGGGGRPGRFCAMTSFRLVGRANYVGCKTGSKTRALPCVHGYRDKLELGVLHLRCASKSIAVAAMSNLPEGVCCDIMHRRGSAVRCRGYWSDRLASGGGWWLIVDAHGGLY